MVDFGYFDGYLPAQVACFYPRPAVLLAEYREHRETAVDSEYTPLYRLFRRDFSPIGTQPSETTEPETQKSVNYHKLFYRILLYWDVKREKFNRMNKALIHWEKITGGIQALSDEYEESGWDTLVLHPGDVSTTTSGANTPDASFRLVVPGSEINALADLVSEDSESYDEFEVHGAPTADLLLFAVVVKSSNRENAVIFPIYYDPEVDREFVETVREQDTIRTDITDLSQSQRFSFSHGTPSLFLPE